MSAADLRAGAVAQRIRAHRLVVVLRRIQPRGALLALVDELTEAGARIFEVTLDAASAEDDLRAVRAHLEAHDGVLVGAGTVRRREQLAAAVAAGADFVVSPVLDPELVSESVERGIVCIPGALTPTEIAAAWTAGATFVKLFPASVAGPSLVRELRGPMPEVELIPTGGIGPDDARAFLDAGAVAVGLGGGLVRAEPAARRAVVAAITAAPPR